MGSERLAIARADEERWTHFTPVLAEEMISEYWSDRRKTQHRVISAFYAKFEEENIRRPEFREAPPSKETLRVWINASRNYSNLRSRFGEAVAHARDLRISRPPRGEKSPGGDFRSEDRSRAPHPSIGTAARFHRSSEQRPDGNQDCINHEGNRLLVYDSEKPDCPIEDPAQPFCNVLVDREGGTIAHMRISLSRPDVTSCATS
jgi:hypothetical protein